MTAGLRSMLCMLTMLLTAACMQGAEKDVSWVIPGFSEQTVKEMPRTGNPTDGVTGLWQTTADGALVAIVEGEIPGGKRIMGQTYLLVIVKSPRVGIPAGTVMGWMWPTAKADSYDSRLFTRCDGRSLSKPRRFTLRMSDHNHLSFARVHKGLQFTPWKLLPYLFRRVLRERNDGENDLEGMIRIWPDNPSEPVRVRYL